MPLFSGTVQAVLAGRTVRAAFLVLFDFTSGPVRLWQGFGPLIAGGQTWSGLGELGSIDGLESALGGTAPVTTFRLSGVDPALVSKALDASDEVKGRDVTAYLQFFDADSQTLDSPYAVYLGQLDVMRVKAEGPSTRVIEVTAEQPFTRRAMPPWGYLSDRDQQRLYTGDTGLEFVTAMASKTVTWPVL